MNSDLQYYWTCVLFFSLIGALHTQADSPLILQDEYRLTITQTAHDLNIDGHLDEEIWQEAEKASNFWMSFPIDKNRVDPSIQTEVMMTYDEKNLYIAAICYGGGPYVMPSLKRDSPDFWQGDAFAVIIDPINEKTNGFNFAVNTAGVQNEALVNGGAARRGGGSSSAINTAWDHTWISEVQILDDRWTAEMAIPFKSIRFGDKGTWGINFSRGDSKSNSWSTWSPVPVQFMSVDLTYTGALVWDNPPIPVTSNIAIIPYILGSTFKDFEEGLEPDNNLQIGGDAKVAITSGLNLDLTINPDFSQVDVDEQVTNLTTVNIRFPERRLFFLENSDIYSEFGIPPMRPFFSRKIGLDDDGNPIPIAYGARLSGNVNKDLRIGVMNLQTKAKDEFLGQNYTSISGHQQVLGRSILKGYFHNRQAFDQGEFLSDDYNRVAGMEFSFLSNSGKWRATAGYGKSWSHQLNDDNYYYNGFISYDSRTFGIYSNVSGVGNNYRADMGFLQRFDHYDAVRDTTVKIGYHHGFTRVNYNIYPEGSTAINSHRFEIRNVFDFTKDNWTLIQNTVTLSYNLNWANSSQFGINLVHEDQGLLFPFAFTDDDPLPADQYGFNYLGVQYNSDTRNQFNYELGFEHGGFYNGTRTQYAAEFKYRAQPWGNFSLRFVQNDLVFPAEYGEIQLFLLGPKLEFNFSRNLFWTTFIQYNTQAENFNINSRIQWRFKPLSDLFIVYSDNYATDSWGPKNRGLVIKMNYWINV